MQLQAESLGRTLGFVEVAPLGIYIVEHSHLVQSRQSLLEELEPLSGELGIEEGEPGDVSRRLSEVAHDARRYRVPDRSHYQWNARGLVQQRLGRQGRRRHDDIGLVRNQLSRERWNKLSVAVRVPFLELYVSAFDVSQVAHRLAESCEQMRKARIEQADAPHLIGLLASGRKQRGSERAGGGTEDRSPIDHWFP